MARSKGSKLVYGMGVGEESLLERSTVSVVPDLRKADPEGWLVKNILEGMTGPQDQQQPVDRLAFETDPSLRSNYGGLYRSKLRLLPDAVLKQVAIKDSLVAAIVQARQNHVAAFGRPRPDRHAKGYVIEPHTGVLEDLASPEDEEKLHARIERAVKLFATCGSEEGIPDRKRSTFAEFLRLLARSAVVVGRVAVEVRQQEGEDGEHRFHSFAAVDAGTIYQAVPVDGEAAAKQVRAQAVELLKELTGETVNPEKLANAEYPWIQVIHGKPVQAFTDRELKCYNFYPVPDVELDGYPVTPLDTVIGSVTTHINIASHNRLYFQSGRAARGMLVIKSDDALPHVISNLKQHFNASINGVDKSWRLPVFGCATDEEVVWTPMDGASRDAEFQYLTDMNSREILAAFMMGPDELPGFSYLSRGTNSQALSESDNEYTLEAARDVGIRPLLASFEDFVNGHLFPLIDPELAKICRFKFVGLSAPTEEKENVLIQAASAVWMTYDDILGRVEKDPVGDRWCGTVPLNPAYQQLLDKYCTVGEIREHFLKIPGASKDPRWDYARDAFWFNQVQMAQAQQQAAAQAQQGPPGGGQGGPPPGGGGDPGGGPGGGAQPPAQTADQASAQPAAGAQGDAGQDLARSIDDAHAALSKGEDKLPPAQRALLRQHAATVEHLIRGFLGDAEEATAEILKIARGQL